MTFLRRLQSFLSGCTLLSVTCFPSCLYRRVTFYECTNCFTDQPAVCERGTSDDSPNDNEAEARHRAHDNLCRRVRKDNLDNCPFHDDHWDAECLRRLSQLAAESDRLERECEDWPGEKFRMECHFVETCKAPNIIPFH